MKITINNFVDTELYAIAARLFYYFYLNDTELYNDNPSAAIEDIKHRFETDGINIRDLNQVDQYFASDCDVDSMSELMYVVDPSRSYQFEVNWLIHHEQKRWNRWHS